MDRKLLILDLDETLIHAREMALDREADFRVAHYHVYRRPHLDAFLEQCFQWFDVAVWTSSSPLYARDVVASIFPQPDALKFAWASDRCTMSYDGELREYYWSKCLQKVLRRGYRRERIIAVDDSPYKWSRSYGNLVRVHPYGGETTDQELPLLARYLERLRDVENIRAVEKRYWRELMRTG